jgi:hypothetical protein
MATWKLTLRDEISATRAALRSRHTPWQLRPSLRIYLRGLLAKQRRRTAHIVVSRKGSVYLKTHR